MKLSETRGTVTTLLLLMAMGGAGFMPAEAQEPPPPPDPADVASPEALVAAVYDAISGAAGEERDWNRFLSLFLPEARLISAGGRPEGGAAYRARTPAEYVSAVAPYFRQNGFFEDEIGHRQEEFGPIVHRFSTYQSKRNPDDAEPFARGINSFQLLHDGSRWWVVTILWASERPDLPIPDRYIGEEGGWPPPGER